MGFSMKIPAYQVGGQLRAWGNGGMGHEGPTVMSLSECE